MVRTIEYKEYVPLGSGQYTGEILSIEFVDSKFGEQLEFQFRVDDGKGHDRILRAWASAILSPKSKLFAWASNFYPAETLKGSTFNPMSLVGKEVKVLVVTKPNEAGEQRDRVESIEPVVVPL